MKTTPWSSGSAVSSLQNRRRSRLALSSLATATLESRVVPAELIAVGTDSGVAAAIRLYRDADLNGSYETLVQEFAPFPGFKGGVRVTLGDFDNDGNDELVSATGAGAPARVVIWNVNADGTVGSVVDDFQPFPGFNGGVFVAAGDRNNDGIDELAVGTGKGRGLVRVYFDSNRNGQLLDNLAEEFAPFPKASKGVRLAFGNTDDVFGDELIVATGPGTRAEVRVFSDTDRDGTYSDDAVIESSRPFGNRFRGGLHVAAGPLAGAGDAGADVIVSQDTGGGRVRTYSDRDGDGAVFDEALLHELRPYGRRYSGGVRLAAGDARRTGFADLLTVPGKQKPPTLQIQGDNGSGGVTTFSQASTFSGRRGAFVAYGTLLETITLTSTNPSPLAIPDGSQSAQRSTITVPAYARRVRDVELVLHVTHTFNADLQVSLRHHSPTLVTMLVLFHGVNGGGDGMQVLLDDDAATTIAAAATPPAGQALTGAYRPDFSALNVFDFDDASDDWILSVSDTRPGAQGALVSWSLILTF
jgi:subtilisin-like proprotein convertase family protein